MTRISRLFAVASCLLPLWAQIETARIAGTVTDSNSAVIVNAKVTLTNVDTGVAFETSTAMNGRFESVPLRIGRYRIAVEAPGFRRALRDGITLQVQQTAVVDFQMEIGQLQQEISVTADAPLLATTEATQAQVIDNKKIVDLPLNGRDYIQLALISAGTGDPARGARAGTFSGAGMRSGMNLFVLDGMDNTNRQSAAQGMQGDSVRPSVDAIQEFKVMTNLFSAEYGRAGGAVVNVTLKSGTNEIHGSAFEFLRNEKLDAKNFFDAPDSPKPPFKRNQYGFSAGGPIKRNKTFIFGDYEWTRVRESQTFQGTIPTEAMVRGDFSEIANRVYDPFTVDAAGARAPFPGNVIPASRRDPVTDAVSKWLPRPNRAGLVNNYFSTPPNTQDVDRWDVKLDHNFSTSDTIYVRYSRQERFTPAASAFAPPGYGSGGGAQEYDPGTNAVLSYNHLFSPTLVLASRIGWNRLITERRPAASENLNQSIGLKGVPSSLPGSATFTTSGYQTLGPGTNIPSTPDSQTRMAAADLSWIRQRHTIKIGGAFSIIRTSEENVRSSLGTFSFDGSYTRNTATAREGNAYADFVLGAARSSSLSNISRLRQSAPWYEIYAQDEWKLTRRLTLNLGVRYELRPPFVEANNGWANFDLDTVPGQVTLVPARDGSRYDRATIATDKNNIAPRVSLAYLLRKSTVIRTGYGVYFVGYQPFGDSQYLHSNPPYTITTNLSTDGVRPTLLVKDGFPADMLDPRRVTDVQTSSYERAGRLAYNQQWSFSIQQKLPADSVLEIGYYANVSHRLLRRREGNPPLPGPGNVNARRPFRNVVLPLAGSTVTTAGSNRHQWDSNANFQSFQVRFEKRLSHGLSLLTSYMWSKSISDARGTAIDGGASSIIPQDPYNLRAEKSVADENTPHRFVLSGIYELPFGRGRTWLAGLPAWADALLGGWTVAGITTLSDGLPLNLSVQGSPSNTGNPDRPDVAGNWRLPAGQRSLERWFNTAAFVPNRQYTYGNAGRNILIAPWTHQFDLAVYKTFQASERFRIQFRAEAFNALNSPNFAAPNAQVGNPAYGRISSADRPRNMQFGLKVIF
jgi:hypothetical protein